MADIVLQDINPRIQLVAAGGQTVFPYPFPIYANTDLIVFQRAATTIANDSTQLLIYVANYTVTNNVAPAVGGTITLNVGATAGDIITIIRNMPENRLVNYLDGGQWSATQFNTDFDRTVMMAQTNTMFERVIAPHYNTNDAINQNIGPLSAGVDTYLPVLPPNCVWMKNNANTAIVAVTSFTGGGGTITLPTVANKIAYFTNTAGNLASSIYSTPTVDGSLGDAITTDGAGQQRVATIPGKNRIINGDFQICQRGAGGSAVFAIGIGNGYTADRWQAISGAGVSITVTQVAGATSGSYLLRYQRDAANAGVNATGCGTTLTRNMCIGAAGNRVTLSFKARAGANFSSAGSALTAQVYTGTGVNDVSAVTTGFTGSAIVAGPVVTLTAALTEFKVTSAPLAANITQLAVAFNYTPVGVAGANDYFDVTDVQLEISPNQTPYERKPFAQELIECQYFYFKTFGYGTAPAQNVGALSGETIFLAGTAGANPSTAPSISFPRSMRATPAVTTYNPAAANAQIRDETAPGDVTVTTVINANEKQFAMSYTGNAGTVVGSRMGIHWAADIDLT